MARLLERLTAVEKRNPPASDLDLSEMPTEMLDILARLDETRPLPPIEEIFTPEQVEIWNRIMGE